jgi:putative endonuclease
MQEKKFYVYIMTNKPYGVFYVGVTSNLPKRLYEHKEGVVEGFTKEYNLKMLVYYEVFEDAENAIKREKRLKRWSREWKIKAVNEFNPGWNDLYETICS